MARWTISDGKVGRDDSAAAHVLVSIDALSAVYLGGASWWSEAAAGRAVARARVGAAGDDVIALADAVFGVRPLPFCGSFF